jgi:hypothetical protein
VKILVERDLMVEIATMLEQMIRKNPYNKNELQRRLNEIEEAFANNTEPRRGKCLVCGAKTNSAMSGIDINYCGPCWNSGKAKEHMEKEKKKPLTLITPEELMEIVKIGQKIYGKKNTEENIETEINEQLANYNPWPNPPICEPDEITNKPDPRCDGCEYQHPFMENMSIDTYLNRTYCNRGLHPAYYKDGKTIQYDPALKLCHKVHNNPSDYTPKKLPKTRIENKNYKHDDSQIPVRSKEKNIQAIKDALARDPGKIFPSYIPEVEKMMERETSNRKAILEILDMLSEHRSYNNELSYTIGCKAEELKARLVGEK